MKLEIKIKQISSESTNENTFLVIFAGMASKLSFNPHTSLPFLETDDRKQNIVWNNKPGPSLLEFNWCKDKR